MKGFKSFNEALVSPAAENGITDAYADGLNVKDALSVSLNGGYLSQYSKFK